MQTELHDLICESLAKTLHIPTESLPEKPSMANVEQWDSLQHINVIIDLEEKFQVSFSPEEITQLNSVESIYSCLIHKQQS